MVDMIQFQYLADSALFVTLMTLMINLTFVCISMKYSILRDEFERKLKIPLRLLSNIIIFVTSYRRTYDLPCIKTKMKPRM